MAGKKCGGYRIDGKGPPKSFDLELQDWEITVYDRKTGKEIATKVLSASACPTMQGISSTSTSVIGMPSTGAIRGWLQSVRNK